MPLGCMAFVGVPSVRSVPSVPWRASATAACCGCIARPSNGPDWAKFAASEEECVVAVPATAIFLHAFASSSALWFRVVIMSDSTESVYYLNHFGSSSNALRRDEYLLFERLEELSGSNEPPSRTPPTDLLHFVPENEVTASIVPFQLLNQDEQEKADLLVVFPKAKIRGTCITASHYRVVVKRFLCNLMLSQNDFEGMDHSEEFARLFRRLSREVKSAPSFELVTLSDKFSDPTDFDGCLGEMLKDMEDYIKTADTASLLDGYVYVSRETETYAKSLLAAAAALNPPSF